MALIAYIIYVAAAAAKPPQLCPTLCDPIDGSPPDSAVPGVLQARTLEWVAISFSSAWKWRVKVKSLSRVRLFATPWTAAHQAPLPMGFSRQEHWSGVPLPSPIIYMTLSKKSLPFPALEREWLALLAALKFLCSLLIFFCLYLNYFRSACFLVPLTSLSSLSRLSLSLCLSPVLLDGVF